MDVIIGDVWLGWFLNIVDMYVGLFVVLCDFCVELFVLCGLWVYVGYVWLDLVVFDID